MLKIGAIRKSNSTWTSAVVLVYKNDGALRFCIDLQELNKRTVKDAYSFPRIKDALDSLYGLCIFTGQNEVLAKVIFSQACVKNSVHRGVPPNFWGEGVFGLVLGSCLVWSGGSPIFWGGGFL